MDLPARLVSEAQLGRIVLLLGAGASLGAAKPNGSPAPRTEDLVHAISDKFLGGAYKTEPLNIVSELAISESSLGDVQDLVAEQFKDLAPASFHVKVPQLRWLGLATTNYDQVIESAYSQVSNPIQFLSPILSNKDRMSDALRSVSNVVFLKLHGCISVTRDRNPPLILTTDQYVDHRANRERLFTTLKEWALENTLVAVGQRLRDPDLRQLLLELSAVGEMRPRYYYVAPNITPEESRFWEGRRFTCLKGSFEEFLDALTAAVPLAHRAAVPSVGITHPIGSRLRADATLGTETIEFLNVDAEYLYPGMPTVAADPQNFYKGVNVGWGAVEANLDVRRHLVDRILLDVVLQDEADKDTRVEFIVVKAEAGAGKTVTLKRIAWEAASEKLTLFLRPDGRLKYEPIEEIARLHGDRLFVFVDDAADHVAEISAILRSARADKLALTIVTAERSNEWNVACERLEAYVTAQYPLRYPNTKELSELIGLLKQHASLGWLSTKTQDEQIEEFEKRAGRQILVALLETTHGIPLEDILVNEFNNIVPEVAQSLYLTVCVLNRLGVPVRAGLIARIHGIPFSEFREKLFKPLEHVVIVREDKRLKDYLYSARHPLIADRIFERVLNVQSRRYDEYIRLISNLNLLFETDADAFRLITRGRAILELFPDHTAAAEIYRVALEIAGDDAYILQQRGIYEMIRPNGNLNEAKAFLNRAQHLAPSDPIILHSLAELEVRLADASSSDLQRQRHREEAKRLAGIVRDDPVRGSFGYHTILKVQIDRLQEILADEQASAEDINRVMQEIDATLESGNQRFPDDPYLLASEAQVREIVKDTDRARAALQTAFERNRRNPFIASRLARILQAEDRLPDAITVLESAVDANPGDRRLRYAYAIMLQDLSKGSATEEIAYQLARSYTPGDRNFEAQFWHAVYLARLNRSETQTQSRELFRTLWNSPLALAAKSKIRALWPNTDGGPALFTGFLQRKEADYGLVSTTGFTDVVFIREELVGGDVWSTLRQGQRIEFHIGFNFRGAQALDVKPL